MNQEAIFHVARGGWERGSDLRPLAQSLRWDEEVAELAAMMAPEVETRAYFDGTAQYVHCWSSLREARAYALERGGVVLSIAVDVLASQAIEVDVTTYPHPVVRGTIPAAAISPVSANDRNGTKDTNGDPGSK